MLSAGARTAHLLDLRYLNASLERHIMGSGADGGSKDTKASKDAKGCEGLGGRG